MVKTFAYYGGKSSKLGWLLPHLPPSKTYIELFGGSFAVYLNKRPRSEVNILNDLDGKITNLFTQIRDNGDELARKIAMTPYSRDEFNACITQDTEDPIERARQTAVVICQSYVKTVSGKTWPIYFKNAGHPRRWGRFGDCIWEMKMHLTGCQIENKDAVTLVDRVKTVDDGLIYADPPYLHDTRADGATSAYSCEMSDSQHRDLLLALCDVKCKVAISGYGNALYSDMLKGWRCERLETTTSCQPTGNIRKPRVECLWLNFDAPKKSINDIVLGGHHALDA